MADDLNVSLVETIRTKETLGPKRTKKPRKKVKPTLAIPKKRTK